MIGHSLRFWTVAHPNAQMWLCVAGLMSEPREWYVYKARPVEEIMEFLTFQYFAEPSHNRTTLSNRPSAMAYLKLTSFWVVLSLAAVTLAQLESPLQSLHLNNVEKRQLESQDTLGLQKRCVGDCVTCFGAGYQECASNSYICSSRAMLSMEKTPAPVPPTLPTSPCHRCPHSTSVIREIVRRVSAQVTSCARTRLPTVTSQVTVNMG